jgi:spectrin alpha
MAKPRDFSSKELPEDVKQRRDEILHNYENFKSQVTVRRNMLEQARQLQQFYRDAESLNSWIRDKIQISSDEAYKDRRNLQVKIQKHQAFEAEIDAHTNSMIELKDKGRKMIEQTHFATEAVKKKLEEITGAWDKLSTVSAEKRQKLHYAQKGEQFIREADEVLAWIGDRKAIASSNEPGKDMEHVELLQKKFEEFRKDIQANEARVESTSLLADKLMEENHPDYDLILTKKNLVKDSWLELRQLTKQRQEVLEGAFEIQRFARTVEETAAWINEKTTAVLTDDYGRDLASVQALQRKHEGLERDLDALEIKVQGITDESNQLRIKHPNSADQIIAKQAEISMLWESLKHKASKRGSKLQDAQKLQRFLAEHRDLMMWIDNMKTLIRADELAKDVTGADLCSKRHKERKVEINAQEDSFKTTMLFGQTLLSENHFAFEEIKEKLDILASSKNDLHKLWNQRKTDFDQCNDLMIFLRDVEQMENWVSKQESMLSSDEERNSLEGVEGLIKKHENLEKSLAAQEEKFKIIDDSATMMISSEHYASNEIDHRRQLVLDMHKALLSHANKRKLHLQDCYHLQQFLHDCEEMKNWISENTKIASDDSYKDLTNLEAKVKKHQVFEAELQANKHRLDSLISIGEDMINGSHYAAKKIRQVCTELNDSWATLEDLTFNKGKKLDEAHNLQQFDRSVKDVELWLEEVENQLNVDELGKDLAGVKKLQKKLSLIQVDISVHKEHINALSEQASDFIKENHFDAENIQQKLDALILRYEGLQEPVKEQQKRLDDSCKLQQFLRDIDDEAAWIKEREPIASLPNRGNDLVVVQSLQKKHSALMVSYLE